MTRDPYLAVEKIAKKSANKEIKAGAIIVSSKGMIIGAGSSQPNFVNFSTVPVELIALQSVKLHTRIGISSTYIYAEDNEENPISAKPSSTSEDALHECGVARETKTKNGKR